MPQNTAYKPVIDLQASFDAELQRLLTKGITPEEETLARRYYSQKERDSMDADQFCGPHKSFPVQNESDFHNAVGLAGHADNPSAVRACLKRKAKANGWSLPKSWSDGDDDDSKERAVKEAPDAQVTAMPHPPHLGSHSHQHTHMDGYSHEHEHDHANEAEHDHPHQHHIRSADGALLPESLSVYLPITRVDATARTVTGQATAEVPDAYGTIFGYYPEAWLKWRGNMREQHDPKKAVGKAIEVIPDEQERAIYVTSKVSRGAQDTWLKIEDGVLTGYSASIIPDPEFGNEISRWPKKEYNGKKYPYLPRYTVAETSYVDNPATPGCNISLVRSDGVLSEIIDLEEVPSAPVEKKEETQDRAGARISASTRDQLHGTIRSLQSTCGCDDCQKAMSGSSDGDNDTDDMQRVLDLIERSLTPVYTRLQSIAGTLARGSAQPTNIESIVTSSITRALETIDAKLADLPSKASLDEVRADVSAVKDQVARIAETPVPGAPVIHTGAPEKRLSTDAPTLNYPTSGDTYTAIERMFQSGHLDTVDKQVDAVARGLAAQRRR